MPDPVLAAIEAQTAVLEEIREVLADLRDDLRAGIPALRHASEDVRVAEEQELQHRHLIEKGRAIGEAPLREAS